MTAKTTRRTIRSLALVIPVAVATVAATPNAGGARGTAPRILFDCATSRGRAVVTLEGASVAYRFRGPDGRGVVIAATPASGLARRRVDRYASIERQMRFVAAPWSYTVYSMDADAARGSSATSGVMVRKGRAVASDLACRPHARWRDADVLAAFPEDDEAWTAM